jgi:hypothetical protein
MGIGDFQIFEDALDRAVFAERAMQRVKGNIRLQIGQLLPRRAPTSTRVTDTRNSPIRRRRPPDIRLTGRSEENPPIRTATCLRVDARSSLPFPVPFPG